MDWTQIPENHPVKKLFRTLTNRALAQSSLPDNDILIYLSDLLLEFMYVERLYKLKDERGRRLEYLVDMVQKAEDTPGKGQKKRHYKHIGDYSLFILGMFPESLSYGKRMIPHSYYADTGRRSYLAASQLEQNTNTTLVFRKLADKFERCVLSVNWVREYTTDPFYQYTFRQFQIT
ncbi:MAG: hypothetical protein ACE5JX_22920 [Acidobacteriota bacterium]